MKSPTEGNAMTRPVPIKLRTRAERQRDAVRRSAFVTAERALESDDPTVWREALEHIATSAAFGCGEDLARRVVRLLKRDRP